MQHTATHLDTTSKSHEMKEDHETPLAVVVMGVTACGKSTVGLVIAEKLGVPFIDGDSYHPKANIDKMKSGTILIKFSLLIFHMPAS